MHPQVKNRRTKTTTPPKQQYIPHKCPQLEKKEKRKKKRKKKTAWRHGWSLGEHCGVVRNPEAVWFTRSLSSPILPKIARTETFSGHRANRVNKYECLVFYPERSRLVVCVCVCVCACVRACVRCVYYTLHIGGRTHVWSHGWHERPILRVNRGRWLR